MVQLTEKEKYAIGRVIDGNTLYNQPTPDNTTPAYSKTTGELIPIQNRGELISNINSVLNNPEKVNYLNSLENGPQVVSSLFAQKNILDKRQGFSEEGGFGTTVRGLAGGAVRQPLSGLGIPDLTNSLLGLLPYVGNTFNTAVSQATDEGYQAQAGEITAADKAYRQAVTDASGEDANLIRNRASFFGLGNSRNDAIANRLNINREDFGRTEIDPEVADVAAPERSGFKGAYPQDKPLFGATRADEALGNFTLPESLGGKPVFGFGGRVNIPPEYKTQATSGDVAGSFVGAGAGLRGILSTLPKFKSINPVDTTTGVPLTNTGRIAQGQPIAAGQSGNFDELLKFELQRPKAATALDMTAATAAGGSEYVSDIFDIPEEYRPLVQISAALSVASLSIPAADLAVSTFNKASNLPRQGVNLLGSKVGEYGEKFFTTRTNIIDAGIDKVKKGASVLKEALKRSPTGSGMKEEDWIKGPLARSLRTYADRNNMNYDELLTTARAAADEQIKFMDDLEVKLNKGEIDKATYNSETAKANSLFPAQIFGKTDFGDFLQTWTIQRNALSGKDNPAINDFKGIVSAKLEEQFKSFAKQFDDLKSKGIKGEDIPFFLQKDLTTFSDDIVKEIENNINTYYNTLINKEGTPLTTVELSQELSKRADEIFSTIRTKKNELYQNLEPTSSVISSFDNALEAIKIIPFNATGQKVANSTINVIKNADKISKRISSNNEKINNPKTSAKIKNDLTNENKLLQENLPTEQQIRNLASELQDEAGQLSRSGKGNASNNVTNLAKALDDDLLPLASQERVNADIGNILFKNIEDGIIGTITSLNRSGRLDIKPEVAIKQFGDEQVLDSTVAAQELLTGAKAAEDLVNPNVNSINVTPARGGEPLVLNTKNLSNNTKIQTIDKRTVENNQLNLSQTEKLTESIISKLYIEKDIYNPQSINAFIKENEVLLNQLPNLRDNLINLSKQSTKVIQERLSSPENTFGLKGDKIETSVDTNGKVTIRLQDGPDDKLVNILLNSDDPAMTLLQFIKKDTPAGVSKESELINFVNAVRGKSGKSSAELENTFIDIIKTEVGLVKDINTGNFIYSPKTSDYTKISELLKTKVGSGTLDDFIKNNKIFTSKGGVNKYNQIKDSLQIITNTYKIETLLGKTYNDIATGVVNGTADLFARVLGANLSTFISSGRGAPLVIAHQVNKRAAATLNRFVNNQEYNQIVNKTLTDSEYARKVVRILHDKRMFTGSRNIPIYIRENAKQIQIALSAMGVNVQEDIIFEALEEGIANGDLRALDKTEEQVLKQMFKRSK
tara:strand:- start:15425 stop:19339 length:3915 start_codon:yes stop_codon:yes gene_type:complete